MNKFIECVVKWRLQLYITQAKRQTKLIKRLGNVNLEYNRLQNIMNNSQLKVWIALFERQGSGVSQIMVQEQAAFPFLTLVLLIRFAIKDVIAQEYANSLPK